MAVRLLFVWGLPGSRKVTTPPSEQVQLSWYVDGVPG